MGRPRKTVPDPDGPTLFPEPRRPIGPVERAMERTLKGWREAGRQVDPIASSLLRVQARAVDISTRKDEPWHIGNAARVCLDLITGFGLLDGAAKLDPFEEMMATMMGTDDNNHDDPAGPPPLPNGA